MSDGATERCADCGEPFTTGVCQTMGCGYQWRRIVPDAPKPTGALSSEDALRLTMLAVNENALAWHSGEDGKARALNVIAVWSSEALAGRVHPGAAAVAEALND